MRDRPYATLYPQLTTKSNSYTVHYRVQALKKVPGTPAAEWVSNADQVVSDYRGSSLVERYVDPANTTIPDFATTYANNPTVALDNYYDFRVLGVRRFAP